MTSKTRAVIGIVAIGVIVIVAFSTQLTRRERGAGETGESLPAAATPSADYRWHAEEIMSTLVEVLAPAGRDEQAANAVFAIFREVDAQMSEWKASSPLSEVNRQAGQNAVAVPADLREVIRRGLEIGKLTDGAFDITWAALWGLWDFKAPVPQVPPEDEIDKRVPLVDYRKVTIDDAAGTVKLERPGMLIGLGGIAKGYALERASAKLRELGLTSFLLSAGGQVAAAGRRGDRLWRVGIRDPRGEASDYFAFLEVTDTSVSTSGDYERYFIVDGIRYHHILDPRTGKPSRGLRSATVICPDATLADALSTACMVLGRERALTLIESLPDAEAVLVDEDAMVHVTSGLQERLQLEHPPAK
ncbi:MAG: FAD:protein FMN transferase [Planctomycetota bacterium]